MSDFSLTKYLLKKQERKLLKKHNRKQPILQKDYLLLTTLENLCANTDDHGEENA